jgi:hypothetical protein
VTILGTAELSSFIPEDGHSMFLRNAGINLQNHTAPKPKTTPKSATNNTALSRKPRIWRGDVITGIPSALAGGMSGEDSPRPPASRSQCRQVRLYLVFTKHHVLKTYWVVEAQLHSLLTSPLDGVSGQLHAPPFYP